LVSDGRMVGLSSAAARVFGAFIDLWLYQNRRRITCFMQGNNPLSAGK
jgi:hypothetical protein